MSTTIGIKITDLEKLKFKQVKLWKVLFEYDGHEYLLIDDGEPDEGHISLYERIWVKPNRCNLELVAGALTSLRVSGFIRDISKKRRNSPVYSLIDREYFVKKLIAVGFTLPGTLFNDDYMKLNKECKRIQDQIEELNKKKGELLKIWKTTLNKGSKQYGHELKCRVAERVKGAKNGEYCEQYNDYYGNEHPEYGGVLTDLFSLPVGTGFYVTNGGYPAAIYVDKHGDKCIGTPESFVKLTKEYHSTYIECVYTFGGERYAV